MVHIHRVSFKANASVVLVPAKSFHVFFILMKIDHGGWVVVYMMNKPKQTKKSFSCLNINSHPQQCVKMSINT